MPAGSYRNHHTGKWRMCEYYSQRYIVVENPSFHILYATLLIILAGYVFVYDIFWMQKYQGLFLLSHILPRMSVCFHHLPQTAISRELVSRSKSKELGISLRNQMKMDHDTYWMLLIWRVTLKMMSSSQPQESSLQISREEATARYDHRWTPSSCFCFESNQEIWLNIWTCCSNQTGESRDDALRRR